MLHKKDISNACRAKLQLDKKAQTLVDEIHFLQRNHEVEVSEMFDRMQDAQVRVRAREFGNPGVPAALWDIRAQRVGHTGSKFPAGRRDFPISVCIINRGSEDQEGGVQAHQEIRSTGGDCRPRTSNWTALKAPGRRWRCNIMTSRIAIKKTVFTTGKIFKK